MNCRESSDNSGFRLLFLQPQPCIRSLKYAEAMKHVLGSKISISLAHMGRELKTLYGYGDEYFDKVIKWRGESLGSFVSNAVNDTKPDIIHSHNAPDYLTIAASKVSPRTPVIHDTHEILSIHHSGFFSRDNQESLSRYALQEKTANEQSDGRIYATGEMWKYIQRRYKVNVNNNLVFLNYVSRMYLPKFSEKKLSDKDGQIHIVYIGCVTSLLRQSHYYLLGIFKELADHKLHIHIHPTSNLITRSNRAYKELGTKNEFVHYHRHTDRRRLLKQLTRYDYGWTGLNRARNRKHLEIAIPNKVFEYVVCGLPVLAFPHKAVRRFIERNGVGLVGENVDDLAKKLAKLDPSELQSNIERISQRLMIEEKIGRLIGFYQRLIYQYA